MGIYESNVTVVRVKGSVSYYYCGRGSPVGNPYEMKVYGVEERNRVCDLYDFYFKSVRQLSSAHPFNKFLNTLVEAARKGPINLGCYCAPKRCHCDTIKKYIDNKLSSEENNAN